MKAKGVKNIHVVTRTWFDKVNGNTYFAQMIVFNWGLKDEQTIYNPFQYGYSSYKHHAVRKVAAVVGCEADALKGVKLFSVIQRGCKKADLKNDFPFSWFDY